MAAAIVGCALLVSLNAHGARGESTTRSELSAPYEEAIRGMNKGEYDLAVIHLKNILQKDPDHIPSRILLGRAYLRQGLAAAAEKELRNALWRGADRNHIDVPLANALLIQRKYEQILTDIRSSSLAGKGNFEVLSLRGRAHYELGRFNEAAADFDRAIELADSGVNPLLGRALVAAARGKSDEALSYIGRALDLDPDNAEAWYQRGEVLRVQADHESARDAYTRALAGNTNHIRARIARASLALFLDDIATAHADAAYVSEHSKTDVTSSFILWQTLLRMGRKAEAAEAFETTAGRIATITDDALNDQPSLLRIAGLIAFAKADYERANLHFLRLLSVRPHDDPIRKLLGDIQLRIGDSEKASRTLAALARKYPDDAEVLVLLGQAYMDQKRFVEASNVLERAISQVPDDQTVRTKLVLSRIGAGDVERAIRDLKKMIDSKSVTTSAGILLTTLQLKREQYAAALLTVGRLDTLYPNNPVVMNLLGTVLLKKGERAAASKALLGAVQIEPAFVPALYNLAQISLDAGDLADAEERYHGILQIEPSSTPALLGLVDVALARGDTKSAIDILEKVISTDPSLLKPYVRLVEIYLDSGDVNNATWATDKLIERHYESMEAYEMLGRLDHATGKQDSAMLHFRRATRAAGFSGDDLLRLSRRQVDIEELDGARLTLLKALQTDTSASANAALVRLDILVGAFESAMQRASEMRKTNPADALANTLVAEVHMAEGDYDSATRSYQLAMRAGAGADQVIGLSSAQHLAGQDELSIETLQSWLKDHAGNLYVERELALRLIAMRRLDEAQAILERLSSVVKNDALTLTTLARCYQLNKDPRARSTAQQAYDVRPDWPVSAETLGWILVTEGEALEGLKYLRDAFSRDKNPLTRFHIASALVELDRHDEARDELKILLKKGAQLPWIAYVHELYEQTP